MSYYNIFKIKRKSKPICVDNLIKVIITYLKLRENQNSFSPYGNLAVIITYLKLRENQNKLAENTAKKYIITYLKLRENQNCTRYNS